MAPLPVWKRTNKWKPASPGGGSQGFSVECPDTSELGHCKTVQYAPEVLASALAREVEVSVPPTELANCEDQTVAVSKSFGEKSMDVRELKIVSPDAYASDEFKTAARSYFHRLTATGTWNFVNERSDLRCIYPAARRWLLLFSLSHSFLYSSRCCFIPIRLRSLFSGDWIE